MKKVLLGFVILMSSLIVSAKEAQVNNIDDYFMYLPTEVHNNWTPYKANRDYEVVVQFKVYKNGNISSPFIVNSTNTNANESVLNAVKQGAPYKRLPDNYDKKSVETQVVLKYIKN